MVGNNQAKHPRLKNLEELHLHNEWFYTCRGTKRSYRDNDSTAIINRDKSGYKSYISSERSNGEKNLEMNKMKEDLNNVKGELGEI